MKRQAFTLVEILIGAAISSIMAASVFALMNAGMILSAKNLSLNLTSNSMRSSLDRVEQIVQQADTMPELIDTSGNVVAAGSAAGIKFDRSVGSPYVVSLTGGNIPAASTTLTLTRSNHAVAMPPAPSAGDTIRIATTATNLRPRIQSVVPGTVDGQSRQPFTVNLTATLGTTVTPITATVVSARLVRNVAFLVMTSNGRSELRYYHTFDTTTNLNDSTKYTLVTDQVGSAAADATPFSLITYDGKLYVSFSLRVRSTESDNGIRGRQQNDFNTYNRTEALMRPKILP